MDFRKTFDKIPEDFDKYRPRYCDELFEELAKRCELGPNKKVLVDIVAPEKNNEFELYINIKVGNNRNLGSQILIPFGMSSTVKLSGKK